MQYEVKISPDKMSATLTLRDDGVNYSVTEEEILDALKSQGVQFGILFDVIKKIVEKPEFDKPYIVAKGKPPVPGRDGKLEIKKDEGSKIKEAKRIDFKEFAAKKTRKVLREGDEIGKLIKPTDGIAGINVLGEKVEAKKGKPAPVKIGPGIKILEDGTLIADKSGLLVIKPDQIYVEELLVIKGDVDYSTGNVDFPGAVEINGDVKAGFVVKAKRDIIIKGIVEAATVISFEGSVQMLGVKGQEKGIIRAKEDVKAKFLENAHVEAGHNVEVEGPITNSVVKARNSVIVTGKKGIIVGGMITATVSVEAEEIGSNLGVKTLLEIGIDPELREKERLLVAQIKLDEENLEKLLLVMKELKKIINVRGSLPIDKQETYKKVSQTIMHLRNSIDQNRKELFRIRKLYENAKKIAKVVARKMLYPGVDVTMFQRKISINRPLKAAVLVVDEKEDKVIVKAYTGK